MSSTTDTTSPPEPDLAVADPVAAPAAARPHWIDDWRPEDPEFWETTGKSIARRNLAFSILSEHIGFAVWSLWSVFVLFLGDDYGFTPAQKFLLTTVPTAVGAFLRLPYTFAVAKFGGRNWTIFSSALLLVPCVLAGIVLKPGVEFDTLLIVAAVAGVGGGNFSSSMANIDAFYPQRLKGWALGLNAGGGNLGVAAVQLVGLAVLATAGKDSPRVMLAVYIPLVIVATLCAALFMDNLTSATNEKRAMRDVSRDRHTWIMSFLYIGTFGSFIGFGFAFGQVLQVQFAETFDTPDQGRVAHVPRPAARVADPAGRRAPGRPLRRRPGHDRELRRHGRRRRAGARRLDRRVAAAVHRRLHRPVHDERRSATARPTR